MITAGIDIGARTVKVVVLEDGKILGKGLVPGATDFDVALEKAFDAAGVERDRVERTLATGAGRKTCSLGDGEITEVDAAARGGVHLLESCRTVVDVGAEEGRVARCDAGGKVVDFAYNEKCAAGAGIFVESMARALQVPVEEFGSLALQSTRPIRMNAQCVVFAEPEVVALIHAGTPREDIARAVVDGIVGRIVSMVRKVGFDRDLVLVGGVALNPGFVEAVNRDLGLEVFVPEDPEYTPALGAALAAGEATAS